MKCFYYSREWVESNMEEFCVLKQGHFELTSGRHSSVYFNKDELWLYPGLSRMVVRGLAGMITREVMGRMGVQKEDIILTAPAVAGSVWGSAVAVELGVQFAFAEKKADGPGMQYRKCFKDAFNNNKKTVVIVEDVVTTGGSVRQTVNAVWEASPFFQEILEEPFCIWDRRGSSPRSILWANAESYEAEDCPLCRAGVEMDRVK